MNPLVSVVMPAKNAAAFIKKSIDSILNQTYHHLELIIINDGSTDNTLNIIQNYTDPRLKIVNGPASGISEAFNAGLTHAKGKYLCRCDSDDLYPVNRIEEQIAWLESHPDYIAVCGMYSSIDIKDRHLIQYNRDTVTENIDHKFSNGVVRTHFCTFMTRTDVLKELKGCRSFFVTAEDIDLQLRLSEKGKIYYIAHNAYQYRLHDLSITHSQSNAKRKFYENFARQCHQQRLQGRKDDLDKGETPDIPENCDKTHSSENHILNQMISESWYWHGRKQKIKAFKAALRVLTIYPSTIKAWKNFLLIGVKPV